MSFYLLTLAFLAAFVSASKPVAITWTDCSTSKYHAKITSVSYSNNPTTGSPFHAVATGTVDEYVTGGQASLSVSVNGVNVLNRQHSVCGTDHIDFPLGLGSADLTLLTCPLQPGRVQIVMSSTLSNIAPDASAVIHVHASDSKGEDLICAVVNLKIG
eukprot:NODE_3842_length_908_cov_674.236321_g3536_i0.p1 GENE.NODE_3842_length_908_cov_674.236321_g3536_i0~~NODE_3842_length_908_cov_674.236321_g3536_i0.p1  ORF type:complete len:158 (-),score=17.09 NODE_3842_length_908_cov_674.236321_g3536_i0:354-827(-)